ncbi:hypothetical protein ACW5UC_24785 [Priestia aryabhattai]|uniref:hypothetical protein n=1 Tax=Priestia megaterium TaxID=1404 RepID=UPI003F98AA5F
MSTRDLEHEEFINGMKMEIELIRKRQDKWFKSMRKSLDNFDKNPPFTTVCKGYSKETITIEEELL